VVMLIAGGREAAADALWAADVGVGVRDGRGRRRPRVPWSGQ